MQWLGELTEVEVGQLSNLAKVQGSQLDELDVVLAIALYWVIRVQ